MTILFWIQDLTARSNSVCWGSDQVLFLFRCSNVDDKPGSASSRKEKGGDGFKSPDLVEVKTGAYTKKCVLPTVFLSIILSGLAGAGIFFLAYYFTVEFCEYSLSSHCPLTSGLSLLSLEQDAHWLLSVLPGL